MEVAIPHRYMSSICRRHLREVRQFAEQLAETIRDETQLNASHHKADVDAPILYFDPSYRDTSDVSHAVCEFALDASNILVLYRLKRERKVTVADSDRNESRSRSDGGR